ncbi:penicillin-binding protein 1C [Carboxylicivirga sp. M1479]|uniref:penicillin-binding protein 1C n=1 Tax=Carboxylicivirga sp. M1479 TaxID=2594476 RepID=UPI00163D85CA|nr:penicillin-binding protein 1C [Carboxylicivirga sp. M1479]
MSHLNKRRALRWLGITIPTIVCFYLIIPFSSPLFKEEYSTIVKADNGSLLHIFINDNEQWYFPPDTAAVPEKLKSAVVAFEDEQFYQHWGINVKAILRAMWQNIQHGRIVSGASTIPMQIARMSQPKKRTYFNKLREIGLAIKLDLHYSKEELLKFYLDHAPYGGNVIGYRTAAFKFYGKDANLLTWGEAATLAVLPNAPGMIYPKGTTAPLRNKRNRLLKKMLDKEVISEQNHRLALLEDLPDRFIPFESHAPHLARRLKSANPNQWLLQTTLDETIQKRCVQLADKYRKIYAPYDINNLSILVADTKTGAIKAYVGSPDFFDAQHGGQVDGVMAPRSSGSILKPFLYALSIDEGIILPQSYIRDLPTFFDGFSPRNANREFQGVATAHESLVRSLNIPAVRLLNYYGVYQFYSFLKLAGTSTLFRSADEYGLPLILGGAEVKMWDMVKLYRGLANNGVFSENYLLQEEQTNKASAQLISNGSCQLTLNMLKDLKRPGSEYFWERFSSSRPIAWKTGTSFGHKDAWAIGVIPEYTIAVWCGNFDGEGNKNIGGAATAGPILFDILQMLPLKSNNTWFEVAEMDYKPMRVCALSGFRATDACPEVDTLMVPEEMKPLRTCDYHQFKYYSLDIQYQCCSNCWNEIGRVKKVVTVYQPDIAFYLQKKGQYIAPAKSHYPKCKAYTTSNSLKIIYPNPNAKLFLPRDFDGHLQGVVCKAAHQNQNTKIYWYLNEQFIGHTSGENKMEMKFKNGWNHLKVIDEYGSADEQHILATLKGRSET